MHIFQEHAFWLSVLLDHLTFIRDAIPCHEQLVHLKIEQLTLQGFNILSLIEEGNVEETLVTKAALVFAEEVAAFKKNVLALKLTTGFKVEMDPTVINHMLNEVEEYITILNEFLIEGYVNPKHPLHHHKLWLNDAYGHLILIKKHLDPIEKNLKERVSDEKDKFHHLHMKALELIGYFRASDDFPELAQFNYQAILETQAYLGLLVEIAEMLEANVALGSLKPELLDHMLREQTYYLVKLKASLDQDILY